MNKKLILSGVGLVVLILITPWFLNTLVVSGSPEYFAMWRNATPLLLLVSFIAFFLVWTGVIYNVSLPKWIRILIGLVLAGITLWAFFMLQVALMAFG